MRRIKLRKPVLNNNLYRRLQQQLSPSLYCFVFKRKTSVVSLFPLSTPEQIPYTHTHTLPIILFVLSFSYQAHKYWYVVVAHKNVHVMWGSCLLYPFWLCCWRGCVLMALFILYLFVCLFLPSLLGSWWNLREQSWTAYWWQPLPWCWWRPGCARRIARPKRFGSVSPNGPVWRTCWDLLVLLSKQFVNHTHTFTQKKREQ